MTSGLTLIGSMTAAAMLAASAHAGTFIFAGSSFGDDVIMHQNGYDPFDPPGGTLTITVAAKAGDFDALGLQAIQNVIDTINAQGVTTANLVDGSTVGMPFTFYDFESVMLHEMGHALGLAHPNLGALMGLTQPERDYANARQGGNASWDLATGGDGVRGTSDDARGDDINLNWRNLSDNPFTKPATADVTTYFRPNTFTNIGSQEVAASSGSYPNDTEAVMVQGTFNNEVQRTLAADDVAMLEITQAGFDGIASTSDDYTLELVWMGEMAADYDTETVDIWVQFRDSATNFAVTSTSAIFYTFATREAIGEGTYECGRGVVREVMYAGAGRGAPGPTHGVITDADIFFESSIDWHFGEEVGPMCPGDATGDGMVDFDDLNEVLGNWGTSGPDGDVDESGTVDFDDLNEVLANWGAMCS